MVKVESDHIAVFSYGDFFVDVCKTRNMDGFMEAWLYHKDGGVKDFMFAVQEEELERFAALVEANLPGYIRDYENEYMV